MRNFHEERPLGDDPRSERLQRLIIHAYENVPFYCERHDCAGIRPDDIKTLADIERLPVIEKSDLAESPPGRITARGHNPAELGSTMTSGYSGEPLLIGLLSALDLVHEIHIDCCLEPPDILRELRHARLTVLRGLAGVVRFVQLAGARPMPTTFGAAS
jgi:hypothetical protein